MMSEAQGSANKAKVTLKTALTLYSKYYQEPLTETDLRDAFKKLDDTGDGYLDARQMRNMLKNCTEGITDEEVDWWLETVSPDEEGRIDYQAITKSMTIHTSTLLTYSPTNKTPLRRTNNRIFPTSYNPTNQKFYQD